MTSEQGQIIAELGAELITVEDAIAALVRCEHVPRYAIAELQATVERLEHEVIELAATCYECNGDGWLAGTLSGAAGLDAHDELAAECHVCNGAGVVAPREARRIGSHYLAELAGEYAAELATVGHDVDVDWSQVPL